MKLLDPRGANELLEFQLFAKNEPSHALTEMHREMHREIFGKDCKRSFDKMMQVAQRPGHSKEITQQLYNKFKE
eukprot:15024350-Heterocapsa_arctica.AAC.1